MVTIKEYAENHGVTIQAVYQQLKRKQNKEFLDSHIQKISGIKYLDDEAVDFLESKRDNSPTVIIQTEDRVLLDQLESENKNLLLKIAELHEIIIKKSEKIEQLQEASILLLEEKKDEEKPKGFFSKLFGKISSQENL